MAATETRAALSPAVFEDEQDVVPEGVSVLLQDPTHVIQHLDHRRNQESGTAGWVGVSQHTYHKATSIPQCCAGILKSTSLIPGRKIVNKWK